MFVRTKKRPSGKIAVQIVEAHRRANGISQHVIRHIGQGTNDFEVAELKKLAQTIIEQLEHERKPRLPLYDPLDLCDPRTVKEDVPDDARLSDMREEQRVIDGIGDVLGALYDKLGFDRIITGTLKNQQWNAYLRQMVLARLANPVSKRRTASLLEEDFGIKTPLEQLYRTLDHVQRCEEAIKRHSASKTLELFKQEVDVLFFDVTTLYFESFEADELREFGFSKDCKFKETQVVLALVTSTYGMPITYRLFPGNTYEGHTLLAMLDDLAKEYRIKKVLLVADRAMFTQDNLDALAGKGMQYIVAAKLRGMARATQAEILNAERYRPQTMGEELCWVGEHEHKGRRLIVEYSPQRARKDAADRNRLIERLMKKVKEGKIAIKDVIPNYGTKKYLRVGNEKAEVNEEKIEQDSQWDGLHGVLTNIKEEELCTREVLKRYRDLWRIEEAFRLNKHDLKMRPIYHYKEERIKGHVALCFIAYTVMKHALYHLEKHELPMSYERLRNELLHAQSSIVVDKRTNKRYVLPSKTTQSLRAIYAAFGMQRREVPYVFA